MEARMVEPSNEEIYVLVKINSTADRKKISISKDKCDLSVDPSILIVYGEMELKYERVASRDGKENHRKRRGLFSGGFHLVVASPWEKLLRHSDDVKHFASSAGVFRMRAANYRAQANIEIERIRFDEQSIALCLAFLDAIGFH